MKRLNLYVRFILSTAFCCWALVAVSQTIIPAPKELFVGKDCFYINESTSLYTNLKGAEKRDFEEYLSTLPAPFNRGMKTYKKNKSNSIVFALSPSRFRESEENYSVDTQRPFLWSAKSVANGAASFQKRTEGAVYCHQRHSAIPLPGLYDGCVPPFPLR